jgi:hypothetical protein
MQINYAQSVMRFPVFNSKGFNLYFSIKKELQKFNIPLKTRSV